MFLLQTPLQLRCFFERNTLPLVRTTQTYSKPYQISPFKSQPPCSVNGWPQSSQIS